MILVTAGSGNIARQLIPRLSAAGFEVRALRASAGKEQALYDLGAKDVVIGDIRDPKVVRSAMRGIDAVVHICPGGLAYWERQIGAAVIDAAQQEGVRHVVLSTLLHPILTPLLQHVTKRDVEEMLVSTRGLNWTILEPSDYMQSLVPPSTFSSGELPVLCGLDARQSIVDLRDVAEVAVKVIQERERHYGARYELSGLPQAVTAADMAATVAKVCGRPVTVRPVSGPEFMRLWTRENAPPIGSAFGMDDPEGRAYARQVLLKIEEWFVHHDFLGNPNVLTWLLGRKPRSFEDYVRDLFKETRA